MTNRHPLDGNMIAADRYYESQASIVDTCPDWVITEMDRGEGCFFAFDARDADGVFQGEGTTEEAAIKDLLEQIRVGSAEHYKG